MSKEERRQIDFPTGDPHTPDKSSKSSGDAKDASSDGGGEGGECSLSPIDFGPGGKGWADALENTGPARPTSPKKPPGASGRGSASMSDDAGSAPAPSLSMASSSGAAAVEEKKGQEAAIFGDGDGADKLCYTLVNRSVVLVRSFDHSDEGLVIATSPSYDYGSELEKQKHNTFFQKYVTFDPLLSPPRCPAAPPPRRPAAPPPHRPTATPGTRTPRLSRRGAASSC